MAINNTIGIEVKKRLQDISDIKQESGESVKRSLEAKKNADEAKYRSDITKKQLDEAIKNGDQVVEVQTLRVDPVSGKVHNTAADRFEELQRHTTNKLGVSYAEFGAVLDGLTDDTDAIRNTHNYANEHGLPVIQRNSTFLLNGEIEVKTDVDLSGSTLITQLVDPEPIEYNRTYNLYKIVGEPPIDITDYVLQSAFTKGATKIPSLDRFHRGSIIIKTNDVDLLRNDSGNIQTVLKAESNAVGDEEGNLLYPLTKDYSISDGFRVIYKPFQPELTFKMPKLILDGAKINAFIRLERNNASILGGFIEERNSSSDFGSIYSVTEAYESHNIKFSDINCPSIGRRNVGESSRGYLLLLTRSSKIKIDNVTQQKGWSGINGNWFRDVIINGSTIKSISSHANAYDIFASKCRFYGGISVHGGGILDIDNVIFEGREASYGVTTRKDYAAEFDGLIRVRNSTSLSVQTFVSIHEVAYDCGRKVVLPDVEILNCHMKYPIEQYTYLFAWRGFTGNFPAELPSIKIDGYTTAKTDVKHKTLYLPERIDNTELSGQIWIEISDAKIPVETFKRDPYNSELANIDIPHIVNNSVRLEININNSLANFCLFGTSNARVKCQNSDIYMIRTGRNANSITQNGSTFALHVDNSTIHKGFSDLQSYGGQSRVSLMVKNSIYQRYIDINGNIDSDVAQTISALIKYANGNIAPAAAVLPNSDRLFNYIDNNIWVN